MSEPKSAREVILALPMSEILSNLKDSMELAKKCGATSAVVGYAMKINYIEDIIDAFVSVEKETGLFSELLEEESCE